MARQPQQHPWRRCPLGEHWVKQYRRRGKRGFITVRGHCAKNPSKKDQIYPDEIQGIAADHFDWLTGPPTSNDLDFRDGNKFNEFIRGWTKYWNEVLETDPPLDPNLIKALIASESSFNLKAKKRAGRRAGYARGLMQITDQTLEILRNENGELKNHLVNVSQPDMFDPNLNICAGVRWLFRKMTIAKSKYGTSATWRHAVAVYKSYKPDDDGMNGFDEFYRRLTHD